MQIHDNATSPCTKIQEKQTCECAAKSVSREWFASTRLVALSCLSVLLIFISLILFSLSALPQATLPFSGVYFVIGAFVAFIALGVLLINSVLQTIHYIKGLRRAKDLQELPPHPSPAPLVSRHPSGSEKVLS